MKKSLLVLAALFLTACGGPVQGTVVKKEYDDADTWIHMQPQYSTTCSGNPQVCRTNLTGYIPMQQYDPEHWILKVKTEEGKVRSASVDPVTWENTKVGDYYDSEVQEEDW